MTQALVRPRLLAVWRVFAALVAAIATIEYAERAAPGAQGAGDAALLLPVPLDQINAIELGHAGTLHRFERDGAGTWFYHSAHAASEAAHQHHADPAGAERIAKSFAAFGRARIERRFPFDAQPSRYGVTAPRTVVLLYRPDAPQPFAQYAIGDIAPDTFSRYVLRIGSAEIVTIPNYQIDNLLALIK